jgi:hypothetical protein
MCWSRLWSEHKVRSGYSQLWRIRPQRIVKVESWEWRQVDSYAHVGWEHKVHIHMHLEYHSVCPVVRIWTPHPLSCKRVCPPGTKRGVRVRGVPIRTTGKEYYSCYTLLLQKYYLDYEW